MLIVFEKNWSNWENLNQKGVQIFFTLSILIFVDLSPFFLWDIDISLHSLMIFLVMPMSFSSTRNLILYKFSRPFKRSWAAVESEDKGFEDLIEGENIMEWPIKTVNTLDFFIVFWKIRVLLLSTPLMVHLSKMVCVEHRRTYQIWLRSWWARQICQRIYGERMSSLLCLYSKSCSFQVRC